MQGKPLPNQGDEINAVGFICRCGCEVFYVFVMNGPKVIVKCFSCHEHHVLKPQELLSRHRGGITENKSWIPG